MKTTRILALALLAAVCFCQTRPSLALVRSNADPAERQAASDAIQGAQNYAQPYVFGAHEPAAPIAEQITGDIAQLARNLENDRSVFSTMSTTIFGMCSISAPKRGPS